MTLLACVSAFALGFLLGVALTVLRGGLEDGE